MRWAISLSTLALTLAASAVAQAPAQTVADATPPPGPVVLTAAVESGELRSLDAWEVGAASEKLLPASLWNNSDAAAVGALLDSVKQPYASPAANRLTRGTILAPGSAPAGSEMAAADAARKRFAALGRLGAADELVTMVAASPIAASDKSIAMFASQADLARGRSADACRRGQAIPPAASAAIPADAFFLRLRAFCAAMAGDSAGAELAFDVARTAGVNDAWLFTALLALAPDSKAKPAAKYGTSLDTAISLAGGFKPAAKPLVGASILAQSAVARSDSATPIVRAEAALAALRAGAIDGKTGQAAFASAAGVKATKAAPIPAGVAAIRTVSAAQPAARAAAIESALGGILNYGDYVAVSRALAPDIMALPKDQTTAAHGLAMARAMLALGDYKTAAEWRNLLVQSQAPTSESARSALDAALVASGQGNIETAKVVLERRINLASGLSLKRASRDVAILTALGVPPPAPAAGFVNTNPPVAGTLKADAVALAKATEASTRKAQGETALYAAAALAPGADKVELDSIVAAIGALREAGLMDAARVVAVEAMIAGGIS
jgi:hypothetical protein